MKTKQHKEIFESDGYIYYLDFGDGITGYTNVQTYQMIRINQVQGFLYANYTSIKENLLAGYLIKKSTNALSVYMYRILCQLLRQNNNELGKLPSSCLEVRRLTNQNTSRRFRRAPIFMESISKCHLRNEKAFEVGPEDWTCRERK